MGTKRIHQSKIWELMDRRVNGRPVEFSIQFVKRSTGELITYQRAVLTSYHSKGSTINIMEAGASTPRKIRRCLVTRYNNVKVFF
jgi:hypothetical protein